MSVTKRGSSWQAAVRIDGRERTKAFRLKVDAEAWERDQLSNRDRGTAIDARAARMSFEDYAEQWRVIQPHRIGTVRSHEQQLRLHVYPTIGDRPIGAIRPSEIQALVTRLGRTLHPSTVSVVYTRLVAIFAAAQRDHLRHDTPCERINLPSLDAPKEVVVLTVDEVLALADAMPNRYSAMVVAGAGLGLRPGELSGLAVDRIDFLRRTVKVDQQLVRGDAGLMVLGPLKTRSSYRVLPLPEVAASALAAHLAAYPSDSMVFTTPTGAQVYESYGTAFAKAARSLGIVATPHSLRHFYASVLIGSGASVKAVQARLGHGSAKTTLDTYAHLFKDEEDRTRTAVDAAFSAADITRTSAAR